MKIASLLISFCLGGALSIAWDNVSKPDSSSVLTQRKFSYETKTNTKASSISHFNLLNESFAPLIQLLENPYSKNYQEILSAYFSKNNAIDYPIIHHILENWGKKDGLYAYYEFEKILVDNPHFSIGQAEHLKESLLNGCVSKNPEAVAQFYDKNREKYYPHNFIANLMESWGSDQPKDALNWLNTLPEEKQIQGLNGLFRSCFSCKDKVFLQNLSHAIESVYEKNSPDSDSESSDIPEDIKALVKQLSSDSLSLNFDLCSSKILAEHNDLISYLTNEELKEEITSKIVSHNKVLTAYDEYKNQNFLPLPSAFSEIELNQFLEKVLDDSKDLEKLKNNFIELSNHYSLERLEKNIEDQYFDEIIKSSSPREFHNFANQFVNENLKTTLVQRYCLIKPFFANTLDPSEMESLSKLKNKPTRRDFK